MRKFFIATFVCSALLVGCSKNDTPPVRQDIKINFTVDGKAGFGADTKAVKTEWAVGDQILLLLEGAEGVLDYSQYNNTIMLTRTAAGWTADASKVSIDKLADGKGYYAVHHEGNLTISESSAGSMTYYYMENYPGGIELNASGTYSITGNVLDLGKITMNIRRDIFQVSIPDFSLTTDYAWMMAISLSGKYNQCGLAKGKAYIRHDKNRFNFLTGEYASYHSHGVLNGNDYSFCFTKIHEYEPKTITFNLNFGQEIYEYTPQSQIVPLELSDKAWLLPELKTDEDGNPVSGSKWVKITLE